MRRTPPTEMKRSGIEVVPANQRGVRPAHLIPLQRFHGTSTNPPLPSQYPAHHTLSLIHILIPGFGGLGLHFRLDGFRLVYLGIAVLMWCVSGVFSLEYMAHYEKRRRYYVFFWLTFLATAGVFLSADFYTTFLFFEIMSFTSCLLYTSCGQHDWNDDHHGDRHPLGIFE